MVPNDLGSSLQPMPRRENLDLVLEFIQERVEGLFSPPSTSEIIDELDTEEGPSPTTIRSALTELEDEGEVVSETYGNVNLYAPPAYADRLESYNRLAEEIRNKIEEIRDRVDRNPQISEVAEELGRDPNDQTFRRVFHRVGSEVGWTEPSNVESHRETFTSLVKGAIALRFGWGEDSNYPTEPDFKARCESFIDEYGTLIDEIGFEERNTVGIADVKVPAKLSRYMTERSFAMHAEQTASPYR